MKSGDAGKCLLLPSNTPWDYNITRFYAHTFGKSTCSVNVYGSTCWPGKWNLRFWHMSTSGPITSWQIDGETMETMTIFLGSKITVDGDCSHEIKRCLLFGRKAMTNLDSILKSRDSTLLTKVCLVKAMVFPVVMYGCESWTIKKGEHQRMDTFELWCWRRLLRVSWTARRSKPVNCKGNQS